MIETTRERLLQLLSDFRAGRIDTETFCTTFEHAYNLELDRSSLTAKEQEAFSLIFEHVIWYSPFPAERERIGNYKGDVEIRGIAEKAAQLLESSP